MGIQCMRHIFVATAVVVFVQMPGITLASTEKPLRLGLDLPLRYTYEEPGLMRDKASAFDLIGVRLAKRLGLVDAWSLELAGGLVVGESDYDGATQSGIPVQTTNDELFFGFELTLGYRFESDGLGISPYGGIGYRYWWNDIQSTAIALGYARETVYVYFPLGVRFEGVRARSGWHWEAKLQYQLWGEGRNKSYLSDADPGYNDPEFTQDSGYGYELSVLFEKAVGSNAIFIEPYYQYWDVERSDIELVTYYGAPAFFAVEPDNRTKTFGMRVGWSW